MDDRPTDGEEPWERVFFCFQESETANPDCLDRAISWGTREGGREYTHVELRFSNGWSTSVSLKRQRVYYEDERLLSRESYTSFLSICIPRSAEEAMRAYAKQEALKGTPFNVRGLLCNFLPVVGRCFGSDSNTQLFCSQYMVLLLQAAGLGYLNDVNPARTNPTRLWFLIHELPYALVDYNRELDKRVKMKEDK